jgi:hypothetical protein
LLERTVDGGEPAVIEREIAERIKAAKLRLRFDKVALRLIDSLRSALAQIVPNDQTIVFTLTAPIRLPSRTAAAIEGLVRDGLPDKEVRRTIHNNQVRLRRVAGVAPEMPRVIGFVHNPESDAGLILAEAKAWLLGQDQTQRPKI